MFLFKRLLCVSMLFYISLQAEYQSPQMNITTNTFSLDGSFSAAQSCTLTCRESFEGKGLIKSPSVHIRTKKFNFKGTIDCDGDCFITAQEPFNQKQFTRKGRGQFHITIDPTLEFAKRETNLIDPFKFESPVQSRIHDIMNETKQRFSESPLKSTFVDRNVSSIPERASNDPMFNPTSEESNASIEIDIEGSIFTLKGLWNIQIADAIKNGDLAKVKESLAKYPHIRASKKDATVFMVMAGLSGQLAIAEYFIELGADVNGRDGDAGEDRFSRIPHSFNSQAHLITAVIAKKADFVSLLVQKGANANEWNKDRLPALTITIIQDDLPTLKALISAPHIDINKTDMYGYTPLMRAAYDGKTEMVEALLQAHADVNKTAPGGITADDFARSKGHSTIANLIYSKSSQHKKMQSEIAKRIEERDAVKKKAQNDLQIPKNKEREQFDNTGLIIAAAIGACMILPPLFSYLVKARR